MVGDWDHNLYRNFRWWEIGITISTSRYPLNQRVKQKWRPPDKGASIFVGIPDIRQNNLFYLMSIR